MGTSCRRKGFWDHWVVYLQTMIGLWSPLDVINLSQLTLVHPNNPEVFARKACNLAAEQRMHHFDIDHNAPCFHPKFGITIRDLQHHVFHGKPQTAICSLHLRVCSFMLSGFRILARRSVLFVKSKSFTFIAYKP